MATILIRAPIRAAALIRRETLDTQWCGAYLRPGAYYRKYGMYYCYRKYPSNQEIAKENNAFPEQGVQKNSKFTVYSIHNIYVCMYMYKRNLEGIQYDIIDTNSFMLHETFSQYFYL